MVPDNLTSFFYFLNIGAFFKNLIRNNTIIESLDVYDLLIEGQYNLKKRLRSGDVVFVEARKNIVSIDGAVNRPAKYEASNEQNLNSIIKYANGISRTADRKNISLERILDGTLKTIPIVNKSQFKSITALDGDLIYIREHPYREAKITGAVPVANGGSASTSASAARTALGVAIGSNVQAFDSDNAVTDAQQTFTKAQIGSTYTAALATTSGVLAALVLLHHAATVGPLPLQLHRFEQQVCKILT